ncbi:hypothetical protein DSM100688_0423 [Bifidobacterium ramosum]|uniref:Uncharacterized protein n=1 Tax=Bifidobacterium ramosum TaxID=1798158 RepID=A0A6L4X454_9BIFI|nr:hypothetical protein [Bifidobacterium ramosum]KAB8289343.1 hypothetical protein DSM100688_0423 [Bifidobacterium ramosum]NEG71041.1 hypothetical protein [Bifidobacterium ramosum]
MSGSIEPIKGGFVYRLDDQASVAVSRQHAAESGGFPFQASLILTDEYEDGPKSFGLSRLTKTDLRNIKTIINNILKDTKEIR